MKKVPKISYIYLVYVVMFILSFTNLVSENFINVTFVVISIIFLLFIVWRLYKKQYSFAIPKIFDVVLEIMLIFGLYYGFKAYEMPLTLIYSILSLFLLKLFLRESEQN